MDELQAKKVLDALAKKMGCDSVDIYSFYSLDGILIYSLMFCKDIEMYSMFVKNIVYNDNNEYVWHEFQFDDPSFCSILKKLEKHKIYANANQYSIYSIEQLMIELELEGYLIW